MAAGTILGGLTRPAVRPKRTAVIELYTHPPDDAITDNLSSHTSVSTRDWLTEHPRITQVFIPKNACWLNLQEPWWRMFRRQGLAGQDLVDPHEIKVATEVATAQLNAKAKPWIWGRPPPPKRVYRRRFTYCL